MEHATYLDQASRSLSALAPRLHAAGLQPAARQALALVDHLGDATPWIVDQTVLIDAGLDMAQRMGLGFVPLGLPFPTIAIQHQLDGSPGLAIGIERDGLIEIETLMAINAQGERVWLPMPTRGVFDPASGDSWTREAFPALDANHAQLDQRAPLQSARLVIGLMVALVCRNIEPQRQTAPKALNAKREKRGKATIPDHFRVTVIDSRRSIPKHTGQGVRASPIPHARRGYVRARTTQGRRYVEWIGPSFVNADDQAGVEKLYRLR